MTVSKRSVRLICPKCDRYTNPLPPKEEAVFMYNTVMSEQASIFCQDCGYDLTTLAREAWKVM